MRDVSFGSYFPAKSFVHKMDARAKILIAIAYMVAVFLVSSFHFLGFAACLLFVMLATLVAKVPVFMVLKSIKTIIFFVVFSAVLLAVAVKTDTLLDSAMFEVNKSLCENLFESVIFNKRLSKELK